MLQRLSNIYKQDITAGLGLTLHSKGREFSGQRGVLLNHENATKRKFCYKKQYDLFASTCSESQKALNAFLSFRSNVVTMASIKKALFGSKIQCRLVERGEYLLKPCHILPSFSNTIFPDSMLPFQNYFQTFLFPTKAPLQQVYLSLQAQNTGGFQKCWMGNLWGVKDLPLGVGGNVWGVRTLQLGWFGQLETNQVQKKTVCPTYEALSC